MRDFEVEKTILVPDSNGSNNFLTGLLTSACQAKGLDASAVLAMCNNNRGGFGGFGLDGIIALIVVAAIFGGNGNGGLFGGNNRGSEAERQMINDAVQRVGIDVGQLASTLNCSVGQIQAAIQQVASQVCDIKGQLGLTGQQIINSIQQGNMGLIQQICNCCCDLKTLIGDQTNTLQRELNFVNRSVERGFSDLGYATRDQTCAIEKAISASTESILAGQRAAEMREMQREITERDRRIAEQAVIINNAQQTSVFSQMLGQAVGPLNAGLAALNKEIGEIQCRLPETKVIACPDNYIRVNNSVSAPFQLTPANNCGNPYSGCNPYGPFGVYGPYGPYGPYGNNGGWG